MTARTGHAAIRVTHLSAVDDRGGAARAARRLHEALRQRSDVRSRMVVQRVMSPGEDVVGPKRGLDAAAAAVRPYADRAPMPLYPRRTGTPFSNGAVPAWHLRRLRADPPDVVNLHWVGDGFVSIESVSRLPGRVLWTLHDMWPFTGGCHYAGGCRRFEASCGACPQLGSRRPRDLSRINLARRRRAWDRLEMTIVCPSRWLAREARASRVFARSRIEVIPYGLDLDRFRPVDPADARSTMGLPKDRRLVLFGAASALSDARKGFPLLLEALRRLAAHGWGDRLELLVFGAAEAAPAQLPLPARFLGELAEDHALARAYSAADVFVAPSIEDNLPNTVLEALACGTPVVGFDIGGMPDMVQPGVTGGLAASGDTDDLARAIAAVLDHPEPARLRTACRADAEDRYPAALQARRYAELYAELCDGPVAEPFPTPPAGP